MLGIHNNNMATPNAVDNLKNYLLNKAKQVANIATPYGVVKGAIGAYKADQGAQKSQVNLAKTLTKKYLGDQETNMGANYNKAESRTYDKIRKFGVDSNVQGMEKSGWGTYDKGTAGDGITPKNPVDYLKQQRKTITGK